MEGVWGRNVGRSLLLLFSKDGSFCMKFVCLPSYYHLSHTKHAFEALVGDVAYKGIQLFFCLILFSSEN